MPDINAHHNVGQRKDVARPTRLDKLGAPGWVWGVMGVLVVVGWSVYAIDDFNRDAVEILKDEES